MESPRPTVTTCGSLPLLLGGVTVSIRVKARVTAARTVLFRDVSRREACFRGRSCRWIILMVRDFPRARPAIFRRTFKAVGFNSRLACYWHCIAIAICHERAVFARSVAWKKYELTMDSCNLGDANGK